MTPEEKQIRELKKRLQETEMERDGAAPRILKKQGRLPGLGIFSKNDSSTAARTFTG